MLLAQRILKETAPPELRDSFKIPELFFLGSDVFYNFMSLNGLMNWNDQKYKSEEQTRQNIPWSALNFQRDNSAGNSETLEGTGQEGRQDSLDRALIQLARG